MIKIISPRWRCSWIRIWLFTFVAPIYQQFTKALAGKFNGKLIDTTRAITEDAEALKSWHLITKISSNLARHSDGTLCLHGAARRPSQIFTWVLVQRSKMVLLTIQITKRVKSSNLKTFSYRKKKWRKSKENSIRKSDQRPSVKSSKMIHTNWNWLNRLWMTKAVWPSIVKVNTLTFAVGHTSINWSHPNLPLQCSR